MHALIGLAALAFVPYQTEGGVALHWPPGSTPIVRVGRAPPEGLDDATVLDVVATALSTWLGIACEADVPLLDRRPAMLAPALATTAVDDLDGGVSVVWFDDANAWNATFGQKELARTLLSFRHVSGEIVDADVAVNFGNFDFAAAEACSPDRYDLHATLTHEVGHVMGLDHSLTPSATMAPNAQAGECDKRELDPDDQAGFCAIYTVPAPLEPDPTPEPEPMVEVVEVAEAEAVRGRDDGCGAGGALDAGALAAALAACGVRRVRRASGGCRPRRRPSPARS
ncbi:MAG: matrixin family metalloprotease [Myxococcota bacterium]